jgi:hypothetical protein
MGTVSVSLMGTSGSVLKEVKPDCISNNNIKCSFWAGLFFRSVKRVSTFREILDLCFFKYRAELRGFLARQLSGLTQQPFFSLDGKHGQREENPYTPALDPTSKRINPGTEYF